MSAGGDGEAGSAGRPGEAESADRPGRHGLEELIAERRAKRARLADADASAFPHAYPGVEPVAEVLSGQEHLQAGEETEERHRVAGRITARRGSGKAAFLDL
ncbi:MAG: hypothetical protein ACYDC2_13175, partial [Solirubrobacteraceae bacterium]